MYTCYLNTRSEPSIPCTETRAGASSIQQMEPLMRLTALILPTLVLATLMGCTQFPELDGAVSDSGKHADFPDLVPIQPLLAQSRTVGPTHEQTVAGLNARLLALRNRAARLRGSVIDANTRNRMRNGVN
jgi:hypothetical protein